jgi:hypothetical protein
MEVKVRELDRMRKQLQESEDARRDLERCLQESGEKILARTTEEQEAAKAQLAEKQQLLDENAALSATTTAQEQLISELQAEVAQLKNAKAALEADVVVHQYMHSPPAVDKRARMLRSPTKPYKT